MKGIPEFLGESSLLGVVLAGTAIVVLAPVLKNVVKGVAVTTVKGAMSLAQGGSALANNVKEGWEDVVAKAQQQKGLSRPDMNTVLGAGAGGAVGATIGGMAGPVGAAVGGGLGGAAGASAGKTSDKQHDAASPAHPANP
ncbi:hypothetical protein CEB3_c27390 [Peptococcaceae bacterium CEB3]|nr:hypothetical protein CEB3_c27390 [Peptococcaceae bacterium CEB3]